MRIVARGLEDFFVHVDFDPGSGRGTLSGRPRFGVPGPATVPELGLAAADPASPHVIEDVEPWSTSGRGCTRPRSRLATSVSWCIGFRRLGLLDGSSTINGVLVLLRGDELYERDLRTADAARR